MLAQIEMFLRELAGLLPLEIFVIIGSLVEEIIAPIPSPLVSMTAGGSALLQERIWVSIIWLALLAGAAKTVVCFGFYWLGDKAEDWLLRGRLGKWLGVSHQEVEALGAHFRGTRRDGWVLLLIRAIPFMPTTPVSLLAGIIKLDWRNYLWGTFIGLIIRSLFFLTIGYTGAASYEAITSGIYNLQTGAEVLIAASLIGILVYLYRRRKRLTKIKNAH